MPESDDASFVDRLRNEWKLFLAYPHTPERRRFDDELRRRHPGFAEAVVADARTTAMRRGDRSEYRSPLDAWLQVLRLIVVTDAFFAQVLYRAKAALQAHRIPLLPRLFHKLAIITGQISIGDPVVVEPGVCFPHGQVVIDGMTVIGSEVLISPFVTIGLVAGDYSGPTISTGCRIGTGARVIGSVTVGRNTVVGANAVVITDLPAHVVAVGAPARVVGKATW
jgi:serine O-acetyltransferase